jgi:hypothetical protein
MYILEKTSIFKRKENMVCLYLNGKRPEGFA